MNHRFTNALQLAALNSQDYDVIYCTGGNGAMWQFLENVDVQFLSAITGEDPPSAKDLGEAIVEALRVQ